LRKDLEAGKDLGMPDGVLINGKGPYRYNDTLVPDGIDFEQIDVHPGKFLESLNNVSWLFYIFVNKFMLDTGVLTMSEL
jgi:hypothetical protein